MAVEAYTTKEDTNPIRWQVLNFFQKCGYRIIDSPEDKDYFELTRQFNQNIFPRFHAYIRFPQNHNSMIDLYFETSSHSHRRNNLSLNQRDLEAKRIMTILEEHQGSDLHRILRSGLNYTLLFRTASSLERIKKITTHDLKEELISDKKSNSRLRNFSKSQFFAHSLVNCCRVERISSTKAVNQCSTSPTIGTDFLSATSSPSADKIVVMALEPAENRTECIPANSFFINSYALKNDRRWIRIFIQWNGKLRPNPTGEK